MPTFKSKENQQKSKQSRFNQITNRFANLLMNNGRKTRAFKLFKDSITICKYNSIASGVFHKQNCPDSGQIYKQIIDQVKPSVETRKVRIGGTAYQVPAITKASRQEGVAIRWVKNSAMSKRRVGKRLFFKCLGQEFSDSLKKESQSMQKRDQMHILAASNRAYARYRWW